MIPELTAITMAELHQGVAMAKDAASRAARTEKLAAAIVEFEPLPFEAWPRPGTERGGVDDRAGIATRSPAGWI